VFTHISGIDSPYHQDEYKWVYYSHPELTPPGTVPHPPLTEFIYTKLGPIVGDSNFRLIPFFFGILNFFLLLYLAKTIFNKRTALWVIFLFTISFYSLLASLMVDVDGAIMPFFFLLMAIGYFKWKKTLEIGEKIEWRWIVFLTVGAIGGFLIKVSAVLPIIAIFLDFLIENKVFSNKKKILRYILYTGGGVLILVAILFLAKLVFPFFNLEYSMSYWKHFANSSSFLNRGWFQTFIQFFKAVLYTSPLLLVPMFFIDREIFKKTRPFFLFFFIGLFFYLFVFDFSIGALDRYFQFMVIPLCIISGAIFSQVFENQSGKIKKVHIISLILAVLLLFCVQFFPHFVPALHPKSEWLGRAFSLRWNFLYPFSGGSGPLGFYMSFLFMALSWILTVLLVFIVFFKSHFRNIALVLIFSIGFAYNLAFSEEYLFGKINGSAPKVLAGAVEFIKNNPDIKMVTVYNDNGGYDIQVIGKYRKRLYVDPKFGAEGKITTLNQYKEHYLEVNVPRIDPSSFYRKYFNSCEIIYQNTDKSISATVYDCQNAPLLTL
jgi:hypothetical protein